MEEGSANGVAVRERPPTAPAARSTAPAAEVKGIGNEHTAPAAEGHNTAPAATYETFAQYNIRKSSGDKLLHGAYKDTDMVSYASLAHSHLLNTSRAILRRLKWDVEFDQSLAMSVCDQAGLLSPNALAQHTNGKEWKRFLEAGMTVKVLSSAIDIEEPTAAAIISSARNKSQGRAMQEHEWTALRLLNGSVIADNSDLASQEVYRQYTEKAREALGADAMDRPITTHLIEFVHQLHGTPFVRELTKWAEKMINSNKRQATYKLYKVVNQLPKTAPFTKVAFIMKHYAAPADEAKFVPDPNKQWASVITGKLPHSVGGVVAVSEAVFRSDSLSNGVSTAAYRTSGRSKARTAGSHHGHAVDQLDCRKNRGSCIEERAGDEHEHRTETTDWCCKSIS